MFEVKFSIIHEACLVNELSRQFPKVRFICPGGFIIGSSAVEEMIVFEAYDDRLVNSIIGYLEARDEIESVRLLERAGGKAFIYFRAGKPTHIFCSQVVERNRGFRIGFEIQQGGLETWRVACVERADAEQLFKDLEALGQIKSRSITETSWHTLLQGVESST